ncbi:MAG: hypothetical protein IKV41_00010 [Oscillospiraceae bacterium]|nr:hypothetical protein [Oscillospiraceae bacterium]
MTVNELLAKALKLLFETDDGEYKQVAAGFAQELMQETFAANNLLRKQAGKEELTELPIIENLESEIPWEQPLLLTALPYGMASRIVYDDMDMDKVVYWHNRYIEALSELTWSYAERIEDIYR